MLTLTLPGPIDRAATVAASINETTKHAFIVAAVAEKIANMPDVPERFRAAILTAADTAAQAELSIRMDFSG